jgi:hypothetical protein
MNTSNSTVDSACEVKSWYVVPLNDIREHVLNSECWCKPTLNDDGVWVHNLMAGRDYTVTTERN